MLRQRKADEDDGHGKSHGQPVLLPDALTGELLVDVRDGDEGHADQGDSQPATIEPA